MNDDGVLKNYSIYLKKLNKFAQALGITVVSNQEVDGDGLWMPSRNKIKIDNNLSQSDEIATYLHELGHALDDIHLATKNNKRLHKAYHAVYSNKVRKSQIKIVVECEARAWTLGREIAKKLKIKLGKWYDDAESSSLLDYKSQ